MNIAKFKYCDVCGMTGQVVIYHRNYTGKPVVEVVDGGGEVHRIPGRIVAHCACDRGKDIRKLVSEDLLSRIPSMDRDDYSFQRDWTLFDPSVPAGDTGVSWKDWRKLLKPVEPTR